MGEEFLMTPLDQMDAELLAELPEYFSKLPKAKGQSKAKSQPLTEPITDNPKGILNDPNLILP
jgi:hypothetical protein